eukprot:gene30018-5945_t
MCTRKELAKYGGACGQADTLKYRLGGGWAKLNSNFGTEDTAENHEELNEVDAARAALGEMTKPGVVTDHEQSFVAGQRITQERYAVFKATTAVYPAVYPPPPAGDGRDVFKAADEAGEGKCTRKEIFNSNFGTEDIAENHEELDEAQFVALWQDAAVMRMQNL